MFVIYYCLLEKRVTEDWNNDERSRMLIQGAQLQRLAEAKPDSPPPIFWVNQRRERLNNTLRNKVKASIAWRLDALQQLEQKIKKARKNKDRDIQRACRLRMEADECDSRVAEAEKNLEEWTKELEALQRNKDVLPPGLKSPPKDDSGQFKAIMTGGIANAIKGAENLFSHIINDVGLKLPNGPESGGWQHVPLFKPVSPVPGSLFWKA